MVPGTSPSASCKIGLFGGSFDPVHLGHIEIAQRAKQALNLKEVRFLPCRISPHKMDSCPASAMDRLEMLRRATRDLNWAVVDDFEIQRDKDQASFSYLTAESMQRKFPEASLFWILGDDQWERLTTWKHPERLGQIVEFIVCTRHGIPQDQPGFRHHSIHTNHPASSTQIREALALGAKSHPWLDPQVADWITRHNLYSQPDHQ
ncbi:MAG: nicotinate (nicotinamide) nucleotide adenylyltransferase [Luteolibacter sp.]